MLNIPIRASTFKHSFLCGDGQLELSTDQDAWRSLVNHDRAFDSSVDCIADIKISLGSQKSLTLGGADTLKIGIAASAEAAHQIQLIWPDSQASPAIGRGLAPGPSELLVRLLFQGKADASVKGCVPIGPLSATFGAAAGGSVDYERLVVFPKSTPARRVLKELFAGIRLPQQIDSVAEIPASGEVLVTRFGGYLKLTSQLSYGYSLTGSRDIEIGKLNLDLDYALKLSAGLTAAYRLAGDFEFEARAGASPGFVRFVVTKSRESEFNFAADFGFDAKVHLQGLPDSADEFLLKAIGAHAERVLKLFDKARTYSNVDELESAAGKLLKGTIDDLSRHYIGKALTNDALNEFLAKMLEIVDVYNQIDVRIIHLYEDFLDDIPGLNKTVNLAAEVASHDDLRDISGNAAWAFITRMAGPSLHDILTEEPAFAKFARLVQEVRSLLQDGDKQEIRDFISFVKKAFPLDLLLSQLGGITRPDDLKNLADEKLQGLAEQILGKAFEKIRSSNVGKELKELHSVLDKVEHFKETYHAKLKEVADSSFSAQLHLAYSRASSGTALVDVEVDLSTQRGRNLARLAAGGDFAALLANYNSRIIRVNKGIFTHAVSASTHLQVNLLGYGIEGFANVLQNTEEALETHEGGLLHIYNTKTMIEERKKHSGELTASTFMLATVAKAFQPEGSREYLVRTMPKMSVQYDLLKEDDKTTPEEMHQILDLAVLVGILPDAVSFIRRLRQEFPKGFGKVNAKYVIRYDPDAVPGAFQLPDDDQRNYLRALAAATMRAFIAARYIGMRAVDWRARLGFAYADPALFDAFKRLGFAVFRDSHIFVTLPGWFTKGAAQKVELRIEQKQVLITLYNKQEEFIRRLVVLDATIDALRDHLASVSADDLNHQVRQFVEMSDDLNQFRENAFFAIFDRLVSEGSRGKTTRSSSLVLEITPPGKKERITKVLTATKAASEPSELGGVYG